MLIYQCLNKYNIVESTKLKNISNLVSFDTVENKVVSKSNIEIIIENNIIVEVGIKLASADKIIDCGNKLVTPGFVDPHTHPVFVNSRDEEFSRRLAGESYESIASDGGGIISSIQSVRDATESDLISRVKERMDSFLKLGTTTIEAKSGYGLDTENELKSLSVLKKVQDNHLIDIVPTFMGAHTFPEEFKNDPDGYVQLICDQMIPAVAKQNIALFNDVFCEEGYFSTEQARRILETGKKYGLRPRLHADEFLSSGAAELAAEVKAFSADHLMAVSENGIKKMAENNIIAILLPGTTFSLGKTSFAPYNSLRSAGIDIAIATDFNPGSCFIKSMPFIISLCCIYLKMPIYEAIKASTYTAAKSLGLENEIGSIEKEKKADLIIWNIKDASQIPSHFLDNPISKVMKNGELLFTA